MEHGLLVSDVKQKLIKSWGDLLDPAHCVTVLAAAFWQGKAEHSPFCQAASIGLQPEALHQLERWFR